MDITAEIRGLKELQRKTDQMVTDLHGTPMLNGMRDSTLIVVRYARQNSPVDTGKLKASILPEIRTMGETVQGVVGSNLQYAAAVEFGSRPHWPPVMALAGWVHRKGLAGKFSGRSAAGERSITELYIAQMIVLKIAAKGTKAQPYLQPAFDKARPAIVRRIGEVVSEIVEKH